MPLVDNQVSLKHFLTKFIWKEVKNFGKLFKISILLGPWKTLSDKVE